MSKVSIVIPARYGSTRFPGKPLHLLNGEPLIWHTFMVAIRAKELAPHLIDKIVVATDHTGIVDVVEDFGGLAVLTGEARNGTERVHQAVASEDLCKRPGDFVINLQGDSPLTDPEWVVRLAEISVSKGQVELEMVNYKGETYKAFPGSSSVYTPMVPMPNDQADWLRAGYKNGSITETTVVTDKVGEALYFSKAVVPVKGPVNLHVGLYAYDRQSLEWYASAPPSDLEELEGLEQLRFLEWGHRVQCVPFPTRAHREVNTPDDVPFVEELLKSKTSTT